MHGEQIRWWQAQECPCLDPRTRKADKTHVLCGGTGIARIEIDIAQFRAIITTVTISRQYTDIGPLEAGDLLCSVFPNEIPLGKDDRVVVLSRNEITSSLVVRSALGYDDLPKSPVDQIIAVTDSEGLLDGWSVDGDTIVWEPGKGPTVGTQYSVRYSYFPNFQVIMQPTVVRRPDPNLLPVPLRVGLSLVPDSRLAPA